MKLLFCPACEDVRKLGYEKTSCKCGASWGYYEEDGLRAVYNKKAVPLGIGWGSFVLAVQEEKSSPAKEFGYTFTAFVIPNNSPHIRRNRHGKK